MDVGWSVYTAGSHLFENGDIAEVHTSNAFDDDMDPGTTSVRLVKTHVGCARPNKVDGSMVYLSDAEDPLPFAHSAEIREDSKMGFSGVLDAQYYWS
jgi:hypothetical protein